MAHPSAPVEFVWSWKRFFISAGIITLIILGLIAYIIYMGLTSPQGRYRVVGERAYAVEAALLSASDVDQAVKASGTVQPTRQVDLRPLASGQITFVNPNLRDGGHVAVGEVLIEIETSRLRLSLRQAENTLKDTEASAARLASDVARQERQVALQRQQLKLAEAELIRRQALLTQEIIPQTSFDQAQANTLAQRQSLSSAENALAQLQEQLMASSTQVDTARINVDLAEKALADTRLIAPFDGLIVQSNVQQGQLANQGDLAARLLDTSGLEVQFRLPTNLFARLSRLDADGLLGRDIDVRWAGQISDSPLKGSITRQGSTLDASVSGVPLYATLGPEAFTAGLRPGAFVTVALTGESFGHVFPVPREAYFEELGETSGIYIAIEKPLIELPEWQGPTSVLGINRASAWLAKQPSVGLAEAAVPNWLSAGSISKVADLFECKPSHLEGQHPRQALQGRRGGQLKQGSDGGNGADISNRDKTEENTIGGENHPILTQSQARALCPASSQVVAMAQPATLLAYTGNMALITGENLAGKIAVIQAFDALADGTWLTLPEHLLEEMGHE